MSFLEKTFKLGENKSSVKQEMMAGLTTFMTMSYILIVNPNILSEAGMDKGAVFTATILASFVACLAMGLIANYPFALSAGMGLNVFFTYTVVLKMGHTWQFALTAVFLEGIIFLIMSLFKIREKIFDAIPYTLKKAVSVGIGLFISLIGFSNAGIIVNDQGTILSLGDIKSSQSIVFFFGIILIAFLLIKKVKGAILFGILGSTVLALILGVTSFPTGIVSTPPSMAETFFKFDFTNVFSLDMLIVLFTFLFVDIFDTLGTLIGVSTKAGMLNEKGELPRSGRALLADAIGTTVGATFGTSTITTFVESASGVADGGRTGLTAITTGLLFLISLIFYPIFSIIPAAATGPALVIVGLFMMSPILEIDFSDYTESIPAFLTIIMMPFAYSIAEGIAFGMISFVLVKLMAGKSKEVSPLMYFLAVLFLLRIIIA